MTRPRKMLLWVVALLVVAASAVSYLVYQEFYAPLSPSYFIDRIEDGRFGPGSELVQGNRNPIPMHGAGQTSSSDGLFQLIIYKDSTRTALIYLHDLKAFSAGIIVKGYPSTVHWYFHDADLFRRFVNATHPPSSLPPEGT